MPRCVRLVCLLACLPALPVLAQPAPPTAVEAVALGGAAVRVYWSAAPGAAGYRVLRDGTEVARAGSDAREWTDQAAEPGRTYRYAVTALHPGGAEAEGRAYVERAFDPLPERTTCDVLVVGATTAGVAAAVTAARCGLSVTLIEETRRLGGMPANGLGATDLRRLAHSSGFFEEFRRRVIALYGGGDGLKFEPRVAHQAIKEIVWSAPGLRVHRQVRPVAVRTQSGRITEVTAEELPGGRRVRFEPRLVVDATECGDVAAWAGAPYRVGREPRSRREPHAGHLYYDRAQDRPLPGSTGRGDRRLQAYAYLMTVKDYGPGADRTIPPPPGYDPRKYEHATPWDKSWAVSSGVLPNGKFEVNQHPQGSDLQEVNYGYPEAGYAERRRIEALYRDHALGYLHYIQTVEGKRHIGLSDDDYRDSGGWPQLLYIREARRFEADVVLDEQDIAGARGLVRADAVGIGDYAMDSHAVQEKTDWTRNDMGEGEFYLPQYTPWHQAPYRVMIPRGVDNLFAPTAVSATHVAYGTLRLEPVRMHFGQAAGVACALALRHGLEPRRVPARQVQAELLSGRAGPYPPSLYVLPDVPPDHPHHAAIHMLAARGFFPAPEVEPRTASTVMASAPFAPDATFTVGEALEWLARLAERSAAPGWPQGYSQAVRVPAGWDARAAETVTRAVTVRLLADFMGWDVPAGAPTYADVLPGSPVGRAAEALRARWLDSRLWDHAEAHAPGGKLYLRPDQPVTRGQFAGLMWMVHAHLGPAWYDHPLDIPPMRPVRR